MSSGDWTIGQRGPLPPGTTIGFYRLETPVGEGGMGTVYRALDTKLSRPVAIKFLSNELADADARRRDVLCSAVAIRHRWSQRARRSTMDETTIM